MILAAALVLAAGLVFFLVRHHERSCPVVVTFANLPQEMVIVGPLPRIEARVKGPAALVERFKEVPLHCEIPLESPQPGMMPICIVSERIQVPQGIHVVEINPASFFVRIDRLVEKQVPVEPDLQHGPVSGYEIGRVTASPPGVRLAGPAATLEKVVVVHTTPIDLAGLTDTARKQAALNLNQFPDIRAVDGDLIEVTVEIREKITTMPVAVDVTATGTDWPVVITPKRIRLVLTGPQNTLKSLSENGEIRAHVDLLGLKPGTYTRRAVIQLPLNTALVEARPEQFAVEILSLDDTAKEGR
ncbi:MAG: hypothetical protein JRI36_10815 [Deltaproteobacteria bacterium]|nr:hypothetical protein [Deltaproteobacteria bacterium]